MSYYEEEEYKHHSIKIIQDELAEHPRLFYDHVATMICFHRRYDLGDKHKWTSIIDFRTWLEENHDKLIWLPLFLMDHSGLAMNTYGFSHCDAQGWDWGQVGIIYLEKSKFLKEFGWKRMTTKRIEKANNLLISEVEEYNMYLTGDVWGYEIEGPLCEDSCWGFYGYENCIKEAKRNIDYYVDNEVDKNNQRLLFSFEETGVL